MQRQTEVGLGELSRHLADRPTVVVHEPIIDRPAVVVHEPIIVVISEAKEGPDSVRSKAGEVSPADIFLFLIKKDGD